MARDTDDTGTGQFVNNRLYVCQVTRLTSHSLSLSLSLTHMASFYIHSLFSRALITRRSGEQGCRVLRPHDYQQRRASTTFLSLTPEAEV